jgi:hypothetical protein
MIKDKGYILRLPFRLPPGQEFSKLDQPYETECLGLNLRLGSQSGLYFFSMGNFPDEDTGISFIPKLWAGLMWALLHQGVSPIAELSPQNIKYTEDPIAAGKNISKSMGLKVDKLDAILDGASPAVYRSDKVVKVMTGQNVTLLQGFAPDRTIAFINEALSLPRPEAVLSNTKLKVAFDLYNAFFREASTNARFLTLNMVLEALAPSELKHQVALDAIERWIYEIRELQKTADSMSEEWEAYDSLIREVGFRKERSIRSSIRSLVRRTLSPSDPEAEALSKEAVRLYDLRSRLVHDGHVPGEDLAQAVTRIREIDFRVLKASFLQVASEPEILSPNKALHSDCQNAARSGNR